MSRVPRGLEALQLLFAAVLEEGFKVLAGTHYPPYMAYRRCLVRRRLNINSTATTGKPDFSDIAEKMDDGVLLFLSTPTTLGNGRCR